MTREQKIIRGKVGVLELAKQLGSVSQACKVSAQPGAMTDWPCRVVRMA